MHLRNSQAFIKSLFINRGPIKASKKGGESKIKNINKEIQKMTNKIKNGNLPNNGVLKRSKNDKIFSQFNKNFTAANLSFISNSTQKSTKQNESKKWIRSSANPSENLSNKIIQEAFNKSISESHKMIEYLKIENKIIVEENHKLKFEKEHIEKELIKIKQENEIITKQYLDMKDGEMCETKTQLEISKSHLRSLVSTLSDLLEYMLSRWLNAPQATSRSQSSILGGTQDFGENSYSTDLIYKLYDDEKRNTSEYIKNLLVAKLDVINQTVKGLNIDTEIDKIMNWRMIDDFVSEHNSPLLNNSVRRSSKIDSEMAPFFGLGSTHKTHSNSNNSNFKPFLRNDSFQGSFRSKESIEELKTGIEKLSHRKSVNIDASDSKHNLIHEDSMMNIGASRPEYDKKTSPIIRAPSIEDIEEEKEYIKVDEEVIRISRLKGRQFTNSDECDESAIEENKSVDHLTSKESLSHLVKSISFNELYPPQEPAVMGMKIGGLNEMTLNNYLACNEPGYRLKKGPVSEFSSHSSKKFFGRMNNSTNTLEDKQKPKSSKKVPLSENKIFEDKKIRKQNSEESLILAVTAKANLSEKGFGSFMNSDNFEEDDENAKSVFSHENDKSKTFKFVFRDPIIEGGGKFIKQKSMEF